MDTTQTPNGGSPKGTNNGDSTTAIGNTGISSGPGASGFIFTQNTVEKGENGEDGKKYGPRPGFQAVILCGPGTSLYPFTGDEELVPKALIPIANKPMIQYTLEWCQKARFESILILALTEHLTAIQAYANSQALSFSVQVEGLSSLDENLGTADVLRRAYRKGWVTGDIVVLPCDLITDLDPDELVKIWMVENAGFDSDLGRRNIHTVNCREDEERRGGLGIWYDVRGEGQIKGQETDFLALAPHHEPSVGSTPESQFSGVLKSLLYNHPGHEFINKEEYPFRQSLFKKCPNIQINLNVRDSGIYFLPFWILKFINKNPRMNSIREDVLPWWSKARWQNRRLAQKLGLLDILSEGGDTFEQRLNLAEMSTTRKRDITQWTQKDVAVQRVYSSLDLEVLEKLKNGIAMVKKPAISESSTTDTPPPPPSPPGGTKIPPMIVYLPERSRYFTQRVDTIHLYHSMCLYMASPAFKNGQIKINPSASIDRTAKIDRSDCLIAAKVSIAGKAFIKGSVLGLGVSIGKGAKVLGSVLMDGASVAEGSKVEGCILGKNVIIGAGARLKNCKVAPGLFVEPGCECTGEIMTAFDGINHGNTSSKHEFELTDDLHPDIKDDHEQPELDKSFNDNEPFHISIEKGSTTHQSFNNQQNIENNQSEEDNEDCEDIENSGNVEANEYIDNNADIENTESIENTETIENIEDIENTESIENIEGIENNEAIENNEHKGIENNKVIDDHKNTQSHREIKCHEQGGDSETQIDKVWPVGDRPQESEPLESKRVGQQSFGGLKAEKIRCEKSNEQDTVPGSDHKSARVPPVRRDSSETEELYKEAIAIKQDITHNSPSSREVGQIGAPLVQAASQTASTTLEPSTSKKASVSMWGTWGLGLLAFGAWLAFFMAILPPREEPSFRR